MSDNLERLRARDEYLEQWAADELETLRQQVKELERINVIQATSNSVIRSENDTLREQLAELRKAQGEPVALVKRNTAGQIFMTGPNGEHFDMSKFIGQTLYASAPT